MNLNDSKSPTRSRTTSSNQTVFVEQGYTPVEREQIKQFLQIFQGYIVTHNESDAGYYLRFLKEVPVEGIRTTSLQRLFFTCFNMFLDERTAKEKIRKLAEQQHEKLLQLDGSLKNSGEEKEGTKRELEVLRKNHADLLEKYNAIQEKWMEEKKHKNYLLQEVQRLERSKPKAFLKARDRDIPRGSASLEGSGEGRSGSGSPLNISAQRQASKAFLPPVAERTSGVVSHQGVNDSPTRESYQAPLPPDKDKQLLITKVHQLLRENSKLQEEVRELKFQLGGNKGEDLDSDGSQFVAVRSLTKEQIDISITFENLKNEGFETVKEVLGQYTNPESLEIDSLMLKNSFFVDWSDLNKDLSPDKSLLFAEDLVNNSNNLHFYIDSLSNTIRTKIAHKPYANDLLSEHLVQQYASDVVVLIARMATSLPPMKFVKPKILLDLFNPELHDNISREALVITKTEDIGLVSDNFVLKKALVSAELLQI
eukprot:TRINITY_DN26989_c0_g1_i1.p2 TRINITY_DN26989_c0_g1~~TRINITY_DN26989_c0_g1_i1.p2  ORF type:complete len:481 (-),score=109.10 TRINITY_DN26989_c0_g1_i1:65-1507(-)